ncbi:MAG: apolipoprotein N-acyltransferase [Verrucomicrobiae bacterium]|nr:apolipoprotein N-acyltransferase [Verrucomicrobiae bacterium]
MTQSYPPNRFWPRLVLAFAAGTISAAAFPPLGMAQLGWVVPALLFCVSGGNLGKHVFVCGYAAGFAQWLCTLYWLLLIPVAWYPVLGWLALSAYLALYTGAWTWFVWRLVPTGTETGCHSGVRKMGVLHGLAEAPWHRQIAWAIACAAAWVALEMARARLLTGFPWLPLGTSQYKLTELIQIASITGVYGISFLMVWASLGALVGVAVALRRAWRRPNWLLHLGLPLIAIAAVSVWGAARLDDKLESSRHIKLALVQPSIPQTMIWDPRENATRFSKLIELSQHALAGKPDMLVWPEAALPSFDAGSYATITNLVGTHRVWMVFGADEAEPRADAQGEPEYNYYNSAVLLDRAGAFIGTYRKRHLVMFGEYVPLSEWLPFLRHFTPVQGGFTPGDKPTEFTLDDLQVKFSVLICFEDIFPGLTRQSVGPDTDFVLNLTNNGWFGESAAQWQHAITALFRAVETGVPLVRCSNNGLTCWIDRCGRIRQVFRDSTGTIYGSGIMQVALPLTKRTGHSVITFYRKHGDLFGWACAAAAVWTIGFVILKQSNRGSQSARASEKIQASSE